MSVPSMQMLLHKPGIAQSAASRPAMKRKRAPSTETSGGLAVSGVGHAQASTPAYATGMADTRSQSPSTHSVTHRPSEGLPTPLLSPTEFRMHDFDGSGNEAKLAKDGRKLGLQRTRQVIQQQINLEILLKHNELRLIEQELAKCQVSMEQLRRCREIPYPTTQPSAAMSSGRGPALQSSFSGRLSSSPAPWGVTDGPYTRHYSQWLLPDSRFDGGEPEAATLLTGKRPTKSRFIRASIDDTSVGMSSRSQRGNKLQALPAGYGQPKEKAQGPLILKRKSDGVMVKLICPVCSRGDFGSAQGFINHCRIGHGRNFASHDQAAEQCGEPVDIDDNGLIVGQDLATTPLTNNVHPLIRTARLSATSGTTAPTPCISNFDGIVYGPDSATSMISPEFRASTSTPHLSDFIKNKGLGLDLQDIVIEAKTKVELPDMDEVEVEEAETIPSPEEIKHRHPQVGGTRGIKKPAKSPATSPILQSRVPVMASGARSGEAGSTFATVDSQTMDNDLEPSPTTESNQAPSLIDDDEEYDATSPASSSASEIAEEDVNITVRDEDDFGQMELQPQESQPSCTPAVPSASPRSARVRRPSVLRAAQPQTHEPKHVTFVSENPGAPKTGGDKKRRKIVK